MTETKKGNVFFEEVYSIVCLIPEGKVLSYGAVAAMMGRPGNSRMVGQAMWGAPQGRGIPCHRVVNSQGRTAPGWPEQRELLEKEGVIFTRGGHVNMARYAWTINDIEDIWEK